ncbi:hypothetical protein BAUCODRAFT_37001 [Baudoinia panamericana UAMH 10762]|uniref:Large ribosomal subunit protein uL29m n=1 Tax=Baudoinia panamericana (strain UAMH 10762) TaxID=717646 RepID=M2MPB4_BAUPA|nr:uncharacterized protein BAUCODRAFT_37001 [Baudoinia panamericana UAMH 10762]EMC93313.1 hypothetical protein BAUCODRAFT_37001 [Baudoinia panamericana UAMH 10762]
MHCTSASLLRSALHITPCRTAAVVPPSFLLPAFALTQTSPFSSTAPASARKDHNRNRGVSALHRTGIGKKQHLSVKLEDLPKPVLDPKRRSDIEVDPDHGLYAFFPDGNEGDRIMTPEEYAAHGRGWRIQELRAKDWEDLWRLWWVCSKERNKIATLEMERKRLAGNGQMYGDVEAGTRDKQVRVTMRNIKVVLTERWYAWENARQAAMEDPEVDLSADPGKGEQAYLPGKGEGLLDNSSANEGITEPGQGLPPPVNALPMSEARA